MRAAVFLDLNGTLVEPVQPTSLRELRLLPCADAAVALLAAAGFATPVVTTQSRIEKGLFSEAEFGAWFSSTVMTAMPAIEKLYVCPHRLSAGCQCHKPKTGLFLRAQSEMGLTIDDRCWVIGDTSADIEAAERLGIRSCLVRTGWGPHDEAAYAERATYVVDDVLEAAKKIVELR